MPSYHWICSECKREFEIFRHHSEYDKQPAEVDMDKWDPAELEEFRKCEHKWKRIITSVMPFRRGANWRYSKGNP